MISVPMMPPTIEATSTIAPISVPSMEMVMPRSSAPLHRLELGIDPLGDLQLGDLFLERALRRGEQQRLGLPFGMVGLALEQVELREGVLGPAAGIDLAHAHLVLGGLEPGRDRVLAAARLAQLRLQLGDVGFERAQRMVDPGDLLVQLLGEVGELLLLDQRQPGEILAALGERQPGALGPAVLHAGELRHLAALLLLVGDAAGRGGAHLHQRLLHLHDDHSDRLGGVVRPVEQVDDVGGDDVAGAGEDAHLRFVSEEGSRGLGGRPVR